MKFECSYGLRDTDSRLQQFSATDTVCPKPARELLEKLHSGKENATAGLSETVGECHGDGRLGIA